MAKKAKTHYAVLGLISLFPMSGYDLKKFYDRSLRFFWSESFGQIYPALKMLEEEGFAESQHESGARGGERKVFSITPKGQEYLRDWLAEPVEPNPVRNELLLKIFFARAGDIKPIIDHLEAALEVAESRLEFYQATSSAIEKENPNPVMRTMHLLTLDYGRRSMEMTVEWVRNAIEELEKLKTNPEAKKENSQ